MDDRNNLIFCLTGGLICLGIMLWWTWRRGRITAGLPFLYLFSMMMIHFVGAWVHVLPWNQLADTHFVAVGFRECFFGVLAFTVGVIAMEWRLRAMLPANSAAPRGSNRNKRSGRTNSGGINIPVSLAATVSFDRQSELTTTDSPSPRGPERNRRGQPNIFGVNESRPLLPKIYIGMGLLCISVLIPMLGFIPSIGAVVNCGTYLIVGGICLICWRHWQRNDPTRMLGWMATALAFPLFTMLTMGFLGFGVYAALMLFLFILPFYRPRWQILLGLGVLFYLGLSVFVNYMHDRSDFRDTVWGGEKYSARVHEFYNMFSQFEWFDFHNEEHLEAVDGRLNQNFLVGAVVVNLDERAVPFANGSTLVDAMLALIPRILWPGKTVHAGSPAIVSYYSGISFADGTSVGVGQVMEFYINYGRWGIIGGFFCFGLIIRWLDWKAGKCLRGDDSMGFIRWYLPGLAFMQTGGSLVEVAGTFAASTVLVLVVNQLIIWFQPVGWKEILSKGPVPAGTL